MVIQTSVGIRAGMGLAGSNPTSPMYFLGRESVLVGCFTLHWVTQTGVKATSQMPTITSLFLLSPTEAPPSYEQSCSSANSSISNGN